VQSVARARLRVNLDGLPDLLPGTSSVGRHCV
jgi:hypothetical protein